MPARVAYDNLRAAVVRILVGGARTLTPRFAALASHYVLEACFCRPGEGHDKGGVESRGKAVRQQALVPIPSGPTLAVINATLLAQMDARLATMRDAAGQTIGARFAEEQRLFRPVSTLFASAATTLATVTPRALVRLEGTVYSVWTRWAGLDLVVRTGASTVTIVGRDGTHVQHPRKRFGERSVDYRHYLTELASKPQAVRQVLPDLLRDLGAPFPAIWDQLHAAHGPRDAARLFAKVLSQLEATAPRSRSPRSLTRSPPARRCSSPSRRHAQESPPSRPRRSRPGSAASTWGAGARPITMSGSARWRDDRRPDSRSGRGANARPQVARRRPHV